MAKQRPSSQVVEAAPPPPPRGEGGLVPQQNQGAVAVAMSAQAMAELQMSMQMARQFPRVMDNVRSQVVQHCTRYAFADKATYRFPRGNTQIVGASVKLAEDLARAAGNFRWGFYVVGDNADTRTVRGYAWDLETNTKKESDLLFGKLIYRKADGWRLPDEREMLELTNSNGSKAQRNAILALMPWDLVTDLINLCLDTIRKVDRQDPDKARKGLVDNFARMGISGAELTDYLGHPLDHMTEDELEVFRGIYGAIQQKESTWADFVNQKAAGEGLQTPTGSAGPRTARDMRSRLKEQAEAAANQPKE